MVEEVFANLVDQFSDPFTFYRELIQNAMDAGSNQVDCLCEYDAEKQRALVTVSDSGEGMSERTIDEQLTKLFSSTKENDFTKIGKFGIGFVSIFAIQPEVVILDTGREGKYWRVVFPPNSTAWRLYRLEYPVEGTTIRLYKRLPAVGWPEFLQRSRDTIQYWCGYSETRVSFNGEVLNKELEVTSPCAVPVTGPGTRAVIGITSEAAPVYGMYNHGLTLKEGHEALLPGLTFRIKSNYLEHTLTRDNVIRDKNYDKAMNILRQAASKELPLALTRRLADLQSQLPARLSELEELLAAASNWLSHHPKVLAALAATPLLPSHHHGQVSLRQLKSKGFLEGACYYDTQSGTVTQALAKEDIPVLWGEEAATLLSLYCDRPCYRANEAVACPVPLEKTQMPPGWSVVEDSMREYLRLGENRLSGVQLADFNYAGSCIQHVACLAETRPGQATRLFHRGIWRNLSFYPGRLLVNQQHPLVLEALARLQEQPEICAYALSKAALLQDGLPQDLESKMLKRCWG